MMVDIETFPTVIKALFFVRTVIVVQGSVLKINISYVKKNK